MDCFFSFIEIVKKERTANIGLWKVELLGPCMWIIRSVYQSGPQGHKRVARMSLGLDLSDADPQNSEKREPFPYS